MTPQQTETIRKKMRIETGFLRENLHRQDGVFVTIRAHDPWKDVDITQSIDPLCITCKIMPILEHARVKARGSRTQKPLDEIQVVL